MSTSLIFSVLMLSGAAGPVPLAPPSVSPGPVAEANRVTDIVSGRAILRMKNGMSVETLPQVSQIRTLHHGWRLVALEQAETPDETRARILSLRRDPRIATIQPEHWYRPSLRPNDALIAQLWPLTPLGLEGAWDLTQGDSTQRLGVIDTGARSSHFDLQNRAHAGYDFISDAARAGDGDGRDEDYFDPGETSCNGEELDLRTHGDHVTATLVGNANNGFGIAGVNWNAKYVAARAMNACGGAEGDLLDALAWMGGWPVEGVPGMDRPVDIINLSLGTPSSCSPAMQTYVQALRAEKNVVLVAATGNEGNDVSPHSPASCEGVISVAAYGPDATRSLAPYANFDGRVDVVAPGGDTRTGIERGILSACGESDSCFQFAQGTSMAAPWVTGAISLMLALKPDLDRDRIVPLLQQTGATCAGCGDSVALRIDRLLEATALENTTPFSAPENTCPTTRCGPGGECDSDERCLLQADGATCCIASCDADVLGSCESGERCVPTQNEGICRRAGDRAEGATCDDDPESCSPHLLCATINSKTLCVQRCGDGQLLCRSDEQRCTPAGELSICLPVMREEDANQAEFCDLRRGNWDCAESWACVDDPAWTQGPSHLGRCIEGAAGDAPGGGRCNASEDCASGLCDVGLCAVPCHPDGSCHANAACDNDAIPGGMCRPETCQEDAQCPAGWSCATANGTQVCIAESGSSCAAFRFDANAETLGIACFFAFLRGKRRRRAGNPR